MSNKKQPYHNFSYDEHARTCAQDDFLGQMRRTVQGVPISDDQIQMIVNAIKAALKFQPDDALLEIACGNGALSQNLFGVCGEYLGVDLSEYLISVAKKNFENLPRYQFSVAGGVEYVRHEPRPMRFTKGLCYAAFQYFPDENAVELLKTLFDRFGNIRDMFVGNIPDKARAKDFYKTRMPGDEELSDNKTAIGIWRTKDEFKHLAAKAGWHVKFLNMPAEFHASHYRYDALLSRYKE